MIKLTIIKNDNDLYEIELDETTLKIEPLQTEGNYSLCDKETGLLYAWMVKNTDGSYTFYDPYYGVEEENDKEIDEINLLNAFPDGMNS